MAISSLADVHGSLVTYSTNDSQYTVWSDGSLNSRWKKVWMSVVDNIFKNRATVREGIYGSLRIGHGYSRGWIRDARCWECWWSSLRCIWIRSCILIIHPGVLFVLLIASSPSSSLGACRGKGKSCADMLGFGMEMTFWMIDDKSLNFEKKSQGLFWLRRYSVNLYKRPKMGSFHLCLDGQAIRLLGNTNAQ